MEEMGVLEVNRKSVRIRRPDLLAELCRSTNVTPSKQRDAG
jgi:CRP/FNR family transcriptional regulator